MNWSPIHSKKIFICVTQKDNNAFLGLVASENLVRFLLVSICQNNRPVPVCAHQIRRDCYLRHVKLYGMAVICARVVIYS